MKGNALGRLALWSGRAAGIGLFVLAARFAWVASAETIEALAADPDELISVERRSRSTGQQGLAGDEAPAPSDTDTVDGPDPQRAPPPKSAAPLEVHTLLVDLGPPRSEVYVDGVRVGHTPYAGTWSCRRGDQVRIHVLPRDGKVPLESRAACRDSMRAVAGRTLDAEEVVALLADPTLPASVKDALRRSSR